MQEVQEMRVWSLDQGRFPREGNGNPLQYSCLENPHGQRSLWAIIHRITKTGTWVTEHKQPAFPGPPQVTVHCPSPACWELLSSLPVSSLLFFPHKIQHHPTTSMYITQGQGKECLFHKQLPPSHLQSSLAHRYSINKSYFQLLLLLCLFLKS